MSGLDGFGTTLARSNMAGSPVFTDLAGITNISGPGISREVLDVSAHDSPDGYREFLGGIKDPGEVSLDVNYDPKVHDVWMDDLDDTVPRDYIITYSDGSTEEFKALLTNFEPSAPFDDKLSASATFKVTGKPESTPAV